MQYTHMMLGPKSISDKLEAKLHILLVSWVGKHLWCEIFNVSKTLLCPKIQFEISCKFYKGKIRICIFSFFEEANILEEETN